MSLKQQEVLASPYSEVTTERKETSFEPEAVSCRQNPNLPRLKLTVSEFLKIKLYLSQKDAILTGLDV